MVIGMGDTGKYSADNGPDIVGLEGRHNTGKVAQNLQPCCFWKLEDNSISWLGTAGQIGLCAVSMRVRRRYEA